MCSCAMCRLFVFQLAIRTIYPGSRKLIITAQAACLCYFAIPSSRPRGSGMMCAYFTCAVGSEVFGNVGVVTSIKNVVRPSLFCT